MVLRVTYTYLSIYIGIDLLFSNSSDEDPTLYTQSRISSVHNTLEFPRSLFEVLVSLVSFGPGECCLIRCWYYKNNDKISFLTNLLALC